MLRFFHSRPARHRAFLALAAVLCVPVPASAQATSGLTGPSQGFAFDVPSHSLRQVIGTLGSASLGPAVLENLTFASAAPQRGGTSSSHGIACRPGQCSVVLGLGSGQLEQYPIPEQIGTPEAAAWSSDGRVAVIYSPSQNWIRVLRGLPGALEAQPEWSTESLGGTIAALALNPDGQHLMLALTGDHAGVFEVTASGAFVPVLEGVSPVSLAFSSDGGTLYALDAGTRSVSELRMASGLTQTWPVDGIEDPVSVQSGRNSAGLEVVYVAGRNDQSLAVYGTANHALAERISLNFPPMQLQPLANGFLLTTRSSQDELLWSYAAGRGVFFVPVTPLDAAEPSGIQQQRRVRR